MSGQDSDLIASLAFEYTTYFFDKMTIKEYILFAETLKLQRRKIKSLEKKSETLLNMSNKLYHFINLICNKSHELKTCFSSLLVQKNIEIELDLTFIIKNKDLIFFIISGNISIILSKYKNNINKKEDELFKIVEKQEIVLGIFSKGCYLFFEFLRSVYLENIYDNDCKLVLRCTESSLILTSKENKNYMIVDFESKKDFVKFFNDEKKENENEIENEVNSYLSRNSFNTNVNLKYNETNEFVNKEKSSLNIYDNVSIKEISTKNVVNCNNIIKNDNIISNYYLLFISINFEYLDILKSDFSIFENFFSEFKYKTNKHLDLSLKDFFNVLKYSTLTTNDYKTLLTKIKDESDDNSKIELFNEFKSAIISFFELRDIFLENALIPFLFYSILNSKIIINVSSKNTSLTIHSNNLNFNENNNKYQYSYQHPYTYLSNNYNFTLNSIFDLSFNNEKFCSPNNLESSFIKQIYLENKEEFRSFLIKKFKTNNENQLQLKNKQINQEKNQNVKSLKDKIVEYNKLRLELIENEIEYRKERKKIYSKVICVVCFKNVRCVINDCGHVLYCDFCIHKMKICFICGISIVNYIKLYRN